MTAQATGRAPGKVLLLGEHAVVYGEPALGFSLSRGVVAAIRPGRGAVKVLTTHGSIVLPEDRRGATPMEIVQAALGALSKSVDVAITLEIPPMAGFGTSAALAIALLRAKREYIGALVRHREPRSAMLAQAMEIERVAHSITSGVDPAICLHEGLVGFERTGPKPRIRHLRAPSPLTLVVGVRGTHGGTRVTVNSIAALRRRAPSLVHATTSMLGAATRCAYRALAHDDIELLGRTMNLAHGVLSGLGLVGDDVEEAVVEARSAGALGAKMSGAGGQGGAFIALARSRSSANAILRRVIDLGAFAWIETVS